MKKHLRFFTSALVLILAVFPAACKTDNTMGEQIEQTIETMDYAIVGSFSQGLARVEKDGKCGFIDGTGKLIIPLIYDADRYSYFSEGLALVYTGGRYLNASQRIMEGGKCGFIDKTGKVIIPLEYDNATAFSEGFAIVEKNKKQYIVDTIGQVVATLNTYYGDKESSPGSSNKIRPFSNGLAAVSIDNKWGYIDRAGNEVIPVGRYEFGWRDFSEELSVAGTREISGGVGHSSKYGFIDKDGEIVILFNYDWLGSFSDGLAAGCISDENYNRKYGVINKSGEVVLPFEYEYIGDFSEGLFGFIKDGVLGYMDKTGSIVISLDIEQPTSSYVGPQLLPFRDGLAIVYGGETMDGSLMSPNSIAKWGVIDKTGNVVVPFEYDYISGVSDGLAVVFVGHADFYHDYFNGTWDILQIEG